MIITPERQEFTAILKQHENLDASYLTVPFSVPEIYGRKGSVKITCTFDGVPYRGSLAPMGNGEHVLIVIKKIRKTIGKTFGDTVQVIMAPDTAIRKVTLPPQLAEIFNQKPIAAAAFAKLSYTHQKENITWLEDAKKPETRQRRLEKLLTKLDPSSTPAA